MKQETIAVPVELVRELQSVARVKLAMPMDKGQLMSLTSSYHQLVSRLPDPPKPDVVNECARAFGAHEDEYGRDRAMREALRKYRELGCPELPE